MIEKARENLRAAEKLLELGLMNAVANRAYFGAYHAFWWALSGAGLYPPENDSGERYWPHKRISQTVEREFHNLFSSEELEEYDSILLSNRIKADYDPDDIQEIEARTSLEVLNNLLKTVEESLHE